VAEEPTEFWGALAIDPVEIALPSGSGFTLRAYRSSRAIEGTDISERESEEDMFARQTDEVYGEEDLPDFDEDELTRQALGSRAGEGAEDEAAQEAAARADQKAGKRGKKAEDTSVDLEQAADEDREPEDEGEAEEEVPLFLTHKGKLLLFKSPEGLVDFVKSGAPNDMKQLPEWSRLSATLNVDEVEPAEDDAYELDLVVENLRGGHDAWDSDLVLSAGEVARDLSYALRLDGVLTMLSPGSPLDDLDEALRAASAGGVGGFLAKRRVRKIGAQQASLGWRTVIGKISGAVDWRD
jgi:hypothetical protein